MAPDSCEESHLFELGSASGEITVCIDDDKPVCLHFTSTIKLCVLYNNSIQQSPLQESEAVSYSPILSNSSEQNEAVSDQQMVVERSARTRSEKRKKGIDVVEKAQDNESLSKYKKRLRGKKASSPVLVGEDKPRTSQTKASQSRGRESPWNARSLRIRLKTEKTASLDGIKAEPESTEAIMPGQNTRKLKAGHSKRCAKISEGVMATKNDPDSPLEMDKESDSHEDSEFVEESGHKLTQQKEIFCKYCEKSFPNQKSFFDHRRTPESSLHCAVCGKSEPYRAHLIVHLMRHNSSTDKISVTKALSQRDEFILHEENKELTSQNNQEKEAKTSGEFEQKVSRKKTQVQCNICKMFVSSVDSLKIHTMLHTGECPYRCCVCDKTFASLSSRQHHMDTHWTVQRFRCTPCNLRFDSRADLAKHSLTHEIKCPLCFQQFPNRTSRSCHYRTEHPNEILKCSICSNLFPTQEELNRHLIYHRKGKREQCPICGVMVFKLKDHMQLHDQKSEEKMYACDQCPMRYLRRSNLERHMLIHTGERPYACHYCPQRFRSNGMLHKHLFTHTAEKPYQCELCGKRFALKSNLGVHMRTHSNDKPFKCPYCPHGFNHKNSLIGHINSKHTHSQEKESRTLPTQPSLPTPPAFSVSVSNMPDSLHHSTAEPRPQTQPDLNYVYLDIDSGSTTTTSKAAAGPPPVVSQMTSHSLLSLMESSTSHPSHSSSAEMLTTPGSHLASLALAEKLDPALAAASYLQSLHDKTTAEGQQAKDYSREISLASSMLLDTDKMFAGKYDMDTKPGQDY